MKLKGIFELLIKKKLELLKWNEIIHWKVNKFIVLAKGRSISREIKLLALKSLKE